MGIPNLLRFLKPLIEPVHIKKYAGRRVGVDAYSWLHKGAYSCSLELCTRPRTEGAKRYLNYFMHYINLLRHYNVTPVVVFDGGNLPSKSDTETERHKRREANLQLAKEKLREGDVRGATEYFQKAVNITPSMAHQLIQMLRMEKIEFLVAPYEADAQLAYLSSLEEERGGISAIITEDSDLIAYGCPAIIFKMDRNGNGEELLMNKVFNIVTKGLSFEGFDIKLFTGMCVLAGCDFLPSIQGIGVRRAYTLVSKYKNLDRVLSVLKLDKKYTVPDHYEDSFTKALAVFNHATIYDVETKSLKPLKPLEDERMHYLTGDQSILGPWKRDIPSKIATKIAEGFLNPITKEAFDIIPSPRKGIKNAKISILKPSKENYLQISPNDDAYMDIFASESITQDVKEDEISGKMYMKDTYALDKLVSEESEQVCKTMNRKVEEIRIPDNNPFKKRKVEAFNGKEDDASISMEEFAEQSVVVDCTPVSQESVGSMPKEPLTNSKSKNAKKNVKAKVAKGKSGKNNQDEKGGILKFFVRL